MGDAAQHLLSVVNQELDLSKIEAGKLTLELADFSLADLMRGVHDMVAPRAAEKGLAFELDLPPELADRGSIGLFDLYRGQAWCRCGRLDGGGPAKRTGVFLRMKSMTSGPRSM